MTGEFMSEPLKVLIVDDSALMRNLISRIVESVPDLTVWGTAMNGVFALQKIRSALPDIIILDLEMPQMNGIEFLKKRQELKIDVPVIILSSIARRGAEVTMEALSLGASDFIQKPSGAVSEDIHLVKDHLIDLIRVWGGRHRRSSSHDVPERPTLTAREAPPATETPVRPVGPLRPHAGLQILAIGISTGGPNALRTVFAGLDPDFPLPIVVVQHMPPGFTAEFAHSLDRICPLDVKEAEEGDLVKAGRILIAPGDYHLEVERKSLAIVAHVNQQELCNGHRPSAGVLFRSVARAFGAQALALIMTGMGRDGSAEIGEIYRAGGLTLAQDEKSSVVFGMPKVAIELGHAEKVVSLDETAEVLNRLAKEFAG
jgi:two-component system chemotaxis response regulator CheB